MEVIVHESDASIRQHDHSVKEFQFHSIRYQSDEWMRNKLNSVFGGSAVARYTPKPTRFRGRCHVGPLTIILFFSDRAPTFMRISEWLTLDQLTN